MEGRVVGRRSRLSFQCEEGDRKLDMVLNVQTTERPHSNTHTHTHTSVFSCTVLTVRTSETRYSIHFNLLPAFSVS